MKTIKWSLLAVIFCSCSITKQMIFSDYSSDGNFKEYQTFNIVKNSNLLSEDAEAIESSLYRRLQSMGYKYDPESPTFLVSYQLFDKNAKVTTYDQPPFQNWIHTHKLTSENTIYKICKAKVKKGSIVVHLLDADTQSVVWSGYRRVYRPHESYRELVYAINIILDKYILAPSISSSKLAFKD